MKLVLDTSIIIDYLRGDNYWGRLLVEVERDTVFYLPTIVIYELFSGKGTQRVEVVEAINNFLKYFNRIELTEKIAKNAGRLYRDSRGYASAGDYIIAASALEIGGTVVTLNRKHFGQIPNLTLYSLV